MKKINHGLLVAAACFLAATVQTFAIEGLKIKVVCPDVVLSWPSVEGETYIVQYRATLDTNDTWVTLDDQRPPDASRVALHAREVTTIKHNHLKASLLANVCSVAPRRWVHLPSCGDQ